MSNYLGGGGSLHSMQCKEIADILSKYQYGKIFNLFNFRRLSRENRKI